MYTPRYNMLNTRGSMREGTNERTYTATKHITTLLLHSRVKIMKIKTYIRLKHFLYSFLQLSLCILTETFLINHLLGSSIFFHQRSATLCPVANNPK